MMDKTLPRAVCVVSLSHLMCAMLPILSHSGACGTVIMFVISLSDEKKVSDAHPPNKRFPLDATLNKKILLWYACSASQSHRGVPLPGAPVAIHAA